MNCADKNIRTYKKGFTLIEMMVVISIMSILGAILIPNMIRYTQRAKEAVCKDNCLQLERMYETYLIIEGVDHSDRIFEQYVQALDRVICPGNGDISYVDGKVKCSLHSGDEGVQEDENDVDDGSVPFL